MWLRISRIKDIVAFLNPFNENVEYIIEYCTNTHAKLFHPNNDGQTESEAIPAYGQLALDHSLQRHFARDPLYSAYHMMQNSANSKDNRKMTDLIELKAHDIQDGCGTYESSQRNRKYCHR